MKRKGFTIVEMAIVLVVIGILLAMAMKAKSFVMAARVVKEAQRIANLETAYFKYVADTGHEYPKTAALEPIDIADFAPYIAENDRRSGFSDAIWSLQWCETAPTRGYAVPKEQGIQVCVVPEDDSGNLSTIPLNVACYIDIRLDDKAMMEGRGRLFIATPGPANLESGYSSLDCINIGGDTTYIWQVTSVRTR